MKKNVTRIRQPNKKKDPSILEAEEDLGIQINPSDVKTPKGVDKLFSTKKVLELLLKAA